MLTAVLNAKFHLFQEPINLFTVVIVSDKTKHKIQEMMDIPEMTGVQDYLMIKNPVRAILDPRDQKMINS